MVSGHHQQKIFHAQWDSLHLGRYIALAQHHKVKLPVFQHDGQIGQISFPDDHIHLRPLPLVHRQHRRQKPDGAPLCDTDTHLPGTLLLRLPHHRLELPLQLQHLRSLFHILLAQPRQLEFPAIPLEQRRTQILFHIVDVQAQCGLRDIQPLRGAGQALALRKGADVLLLL